jgi:2-polyprenyl-3-methyl-5-hydroxy-6-metoxy-1,4-benzoquinol methylase
MQYTGPNFGLSEKIFLNLYCHPVCKREVNAKEPNQDRVDSLRSFAHFFGDRLLNDIQEKIVLDIGYGEGSELIAAIEEGAKYGIGIQARDNYMASKKRAEMLGIGDKLTYTGKHLSELEPASIDVALSKNAFNHYANPDQVLRDTYKALKPGGKLFISFAPPWLHPYGVQMFFMAKRPWAHFLFSEKTILNVRKLYCSDGAERYEDIEDGHNRMTIRKFLEYVSYSQFGLEYLNLNLIRGVPNYFAKSSMLREFTTRTVSAILVKD